MAAGVVLEPSRATLEVAAGDKVLAYAVLWDLGILKTSRSPSSRRGVVFRKEISSVKRRVKSGYSQKWVLLSIFVVANELF